uniref:Uncharacterized protein n=1 Tax=Oryza punctata TaxID=4537 RepID=A0A0E0K2Y8_ORYPU
MLRSDRRRGLRKLLEGLGGGAEEERRGEKSGVRWGIKVSQKVKFYIISDRYDCPGVAWAVGSLSRVLEASA